MGLVAVTVNGGDITRYRLSPGHLGAGGAGARRVGAGAVLAGRADGALAARRVPVGVVPVGAAASVPEAARELEAPLLLWLLELERGRAGGGLGLAGLAAAGRAAPAAVDDQPVDR